MANTTGGLLVYGVVEDRKTGKAEGMRSVDISDATQRRLRSLAMTRIHPPVLGLEILPLASADGQTDLLVVFVPQSPDAPHVIGQQDHLGIPYRYGSQTTWMRERDLERAYAARFTRRRDEHARLVDMELARDALPHPATG